VIKLLKHLFGLFTAVARLWADRQLLDAGKREQREADAKELAVREEKAREAVAVDDPDRTERLRGRFDRSRRSE
jgi:hypothetical protein